MDNLINPESLEHMELFVIAMTAVFIVLLILTIFIRSFLKKINGLKTNLEEFNHTLKQVSQKLESNEAQNRALIKDIGVLKNQMREEFNLTKLSLSNQIDSLLLKLEDSHPDSPDIILPRLEAYKRLWEITEIANPNRREPLDDNEKQNLRSELSSWYFEDGNGLFLSTDSAELIKIAIKDLSDSTFETVKNNLSNLRSQLKNDIELYDMIDSENEINLLTT